MYLLTKIYRRTILYCYIKIVHAKLVLWAKGLHDSMKTRLCCKLDRSINLIGLYMFLKIDFGLIVLALFSLLVAD